MTITEQLKVLQRAIGVKDDGVFGPKTEAALRAALRGEVEPDVVGDVGDGSLSKRSRDNLAECHADLQRLAEAVSKRIPIEVICGYRGEKEQNAAYARGTSKLRFPKSKHNKSPSLAYDACPLVNGKIDWKAQGEFERLRKITKEEAAKLGIKIRHISWDWPHTEIV